MRRYGEVTGLDVDHEYVAYCRKRGFERVLCGSGYELPFADGSFDVVALFDTMEHIPDDRRALEECKRVLRPGGIVFVSVPAYQFLWSQNDRIAHHFRRYTAGRLRRVVGAAGLAPQRVSYFNTLLFPLILPAVLWQKLMGKLGRLPADYNNTSVKMPGLLNRLFTWTMSSERFLLRWLSLPFGHSLIAIARR
jgi:SAM-dependent methyltransferase